jgi:MFS family permease
MEKAIHPSRDMTASLEEPGAEATPSSALGILDLVSTEETCHPIHWPSWQKWLIATTYCLLQTLVAMLSTSYISAEIPLQAKFGGSTQVVALGQSLFIVGTAVGPVFLGPLSDIGGRKWVYVVSILVYALCQIVSFIFFSPSFSSILIFFSFN